ncbi:MAG: PIG-L family deacetylase [Planctomycetes bacterium]|nr:PIG-L family deacetylase [Planctomycetota bacterium]
MTEKPLRIMAIGAHPDDCDVKVGGIALLYRRLGHQVKFVSVTNGDTGHHEMGGGPLAKRRFAEAQASAEIAGIEYDVLDIHNGSLEPNLKNRWTIVRMIREFEPDLVITHRPNDYHPDHRYTSQIVQDSAYTVTVPNVLALTPHLRYNPVFAYVSDRFKKPCPFTPDIVVGIDDVVDDKVRMLDCHVSQFYEWLPYNQGKDNVPEGPAERVKWLFEWRTPAFAEEAEKYRDVLERLYGAERAARIKYAEALEVCEYGAKPADEDISTLFPFFGD